MNRWSGADGNIEHNSSTTLYLHPCDFGVPPTKGAESIPYSTLFDLGFGDLTCSDQYDEAEVAESMLAALGPGCHWPKYICMSLHTLSWL